MLHFDKKIIFNTRSPAAPASAFYLSALNGLPNIEFFKWSNYEKYDIGLFMTYPQDLDDLKAAKRSNPDLLTGLIDPRGSWVGEYATCIDFLIVDSLEMRDFFSSWNKPMFTYLEYPSVPVIEKEHRNHRKIIIGYHGNRTHLSSLYPNISIALDTLAQQYELEFWATYNIDQGKCRVGLPRRAPVRHIQWREDIYENELSQVDIGIAPALIPLKIIRK